MADTDAFRHGCCPMRGLLLRWEMAVWLIRVLDGVGPRAGGDVCFTDVDVETVWWAVYVQRLAELEITVGCSGDSLLYYPDELVTREQMASFLTRAFKLAAAVPAGFEDTAAGTHADSIDALHAAQVTVGCSHDPLPLLYCPDRHTARAETATFLHRVLTSRLDLLF